MAAEAGAGTLFGIDGALARLNGDAILIAVDISSSATDTWIEGLGSAGRVLDGTQPEEGVPEWACLCLRTFP